VSAALYAWVGAIVLRRHVAQDARPANSLFALWWIALAAAFTLISLFTIATQGLGYRGLALAVAYLDGVVVLVLGAIWGLVYYLAYLYTGNKRWFWPIAIFYAALALAFIVEIAYLQPNGFDADGNLTFAHAQMSPAARGTLGLLVSLPAVIAAIGYGSLYRRTYEPLARYRIALVSAAFVAQFGWNVVNAAFQLPTRFQGSIVVPLIGDAFAILAAVAVLFAFRPPRELRSRLERVQASE
jgi:hypothetical protein